MKTVLFPIFLGNTSRLKLDQLKDRVI